MPKGDRLKLKADPEDGTTPVANLLLEAVAMAKISGLQKGAILYLWRQTYGWVSKDGKRRKECKITLTEWMKALDSSKSRTSSALSELHNKGIMSRRIADPWGGYYYAINTHISKWNSNCINLAKLSERLGIADFGTVAQNGTVADIDNSSDNDNSCPKHNGTVAQNGTEQLPKTEPPTLYKEILNKDKEIKGDVKITSPLGEKTREVFARIDKLRGYRPTKRKAEAAAILRMLKLYTPDQIVNAWEKMKRDTFWQGKELFMMTVETQIGAIINDGTHKRDTQTGEQEKDPNYYKRGKYGHLVK